MAGHTGQGSAPSHLVDDLQLALGVELAVLPPYLYALWSVPTDSANRAVAQAARTLRGVVYEEMLHVGLVANLLNALGVTPEATAHLVDRWPSALPGHATDGPYGFTVHLGPLDAPTLRTFCRIELPEWTPPVVGATGGTPGWRTLGELYEQVSKELELLDDGDFGGGNQLGPVQNPGPGRLLEVRDRASALEAVAIISDQGEGHRPPGHDGAGAHDDDGAAKPYESDDDHEVAHYYQFARLLSYVQDGSIDPSRDLHPVVADPDPSAYSPGQREADTAFNVLWSELIDELQTMFGESDPRVFGPRSQLMLSLTHAAAVLRRCGSIPGTDRVAGPSFRYLAAGARSSV